jgi:CheY-like chemotaxis protein
MNRLKDLEMARVLLVDDDPAARLTLKTVLEAGGYAVDSAASAAEAFGKLEEQEYQLVLTDMQMESPEAGLRVLQHARMMEYRPATALLTATVPVRTCDRRSDHSYLIEPENLPDLFDKIAGLIGLRVRRRLDRELRIAGAGA